MNLVIIRHGSSIWAYTVMSRVRKYWLLSGNDYQD